MLKKFFPFLVILFALPDISGFSMKGDITVPNLSNPTSLHYCGKSYYSVDFGYSNDFGEGAVLHGLTFDGKITSSRFGVDVAIGSRMSGVGDLELSHSNTFDVNAGIALGKMGVSLGAGWGMRGVRERDAAGSGSAADFFRNVLVEHNDASVSDFTSDFSLFVSYADPEWFSLSVYSIGFLSLSSHDVSFNADDAADSIGACFMFRVPEFNSEHIRRTLLFSLCGDFDGVFSDAPSFSVEAVLKVNISLSASVSLSGRFSMDDMNSGFSRNGSNEISLYADFKSYRVILSFEVPYETYMGEASYFFATVGFRTSSFF